MADTAPLLERDFARLAGLGWIGKNTMLIDRRLGSFTVLGAAGRLSSSQSDEPHVSSHCGTCTRCLDACPTDAFVGPGQLDARRCISYWTIEHKGPIADEFADRLDDWVFGCDVCQDVCPWNRKAPRARMPGLDASAEDADVPTADLLAWLDRDEGAWREAIRGTARGRAKQGRPRAECGDRCWARGGRGGRAGPLAAPGRRGRGPRGADRRGLGPGLDRRASAEEALIRNRHASPGPVREAVVAAGPWPGFRARTRTSVGRPRLRRERGIAPARSPPS